MNPYVRMALVATVGTWLITALGAGMVAFFRSPTADGMNAMLGFAAGVMIAASFWSLLQPAIRLADAQGLLPSWLVVTAGFLLGAAFLWASDKAVTAVSRGTAGGKRNRVFLLVLSITLHNIPEGLAVGVAFGALAENGSREALLGAASIAAGIGIQNFPEGAAVSLPLRREGFSRRKSFLLGQASGMVEPVAGVLGAVLVMQTRMILPWALSFAAGAMILVTVHELIPECQQGKSRKPYRATMGIVAGFAVMMLLDVMLG